MPSLKDNTTMGLSNFCESTVVSVIAPNIVQNEKLGWSKKIQADPEGCQVRIQAFFRVLPETHFTQNGRNSFHLGMGRVLVM